jgi:hypothetical protein
MFSPHAQEHAAIKHRILFEFLIALIKGAIHRESNITGSIDQGICQIVNISLDK